jgi:hypothetical protein
VVGDATFNKFPTFMGTLMSGVGWVIKNEIIENAVPYNPLKNVILQSNLCQEIYLPAIKYYAEFEDEMYALQFKLML